MEIEQALKEQLKTQRLQSLKARYFELELDRVALEVNGDTDGVNETVKRMENVQKAFDAVNSVPVV